MKTTLAGATALAALALAGAAEAQSGTRIFRPLDSAAGAIEAGLPRPGVAATGEAVDTSGSGLSVAPLRVDKTVRDVTGARVGIITQVISRDGAEEAYAVVKAGGRRFKAPASQLEPAGDGYRLSETAANFLATAEEAG